VESMLNCKDCGWMGQQGDCTRVYECIPGTQDVQPTLQCPKCGGTNLRELPGRGAALEFCPV